MTIRIGSVPYLNAKPLVDYFHSADCAEDVEVTYAVPSRLAEELRAGRLDVANLSSFEALRDPRLAIVPGVSISATGPVKSVRLFSAKPILEIRTVALDTSSLTSAALIRILLSELYSLIPAYAPYPPVLGEMLERFDAGLIIGDLNLFTLPPGAHVLDLGQAWAELTGLPFVYAAWLAHSERLSPEVELLLAEAKIWGAARLPELAAKWSGRMSLSEERCLDYLTNVMQYDLTDAHLAGLRTFQEKCAAHGLIGEVRPLRIGAPLHPATS